MLIGIAVLCPDPSREQYELLWEPLSVPPSHPCKCRQS